MAEVTMPKLSDTMEEGKILRWLKQAGDRVEVGDLLVEVETDKADMEVEASQAGVLSEVRLGEGESAPVGAVIAVIEDGGAGAGRAAREKADGDGRAPSAPPAGGEQPADAAPRGRDRARSEEVAGEKAQPARRAPAAEDERAAKVKAKTKEKRPETAPPPRAEGGAARPDAGERVARPPGARPSQVAGARVKASPLARSLAEELGIDLAEVRGTGPVGRITRRDVEEASARGAGRKPDRGERAQAGVGEFARRVAKGDAAARDEEREADGDAGDAAGPARGAGADREAREGERAAPEGKREARGEERAESEGKREAREEERAEPEGKREAREEERADEREPRAAVRRVPLSRMRASIAKRMAESMREAPHFYLTSVVDMDEAVRLRLQLKRLEASDASVTYNHMVVKAVADALVLFPELNARFAGDAIEILPEINVGIATAVEEGLIVPVLHGADRLGLLDIAEQARALGEKAAGGRFSSAELSGATFSVSNLGMFDVESFTAVINPPQAAILAVGSVKERPVVREGALAAGHTMYMTLSCDHRVVDGAQGGRFLAEVKRRLENPASLLLSEPFAGRSER